jgi:protease IV
VAFVKGAWGILVAVKDALVLLFLLLFFWAIFAGLSMSGGEQAPAQGALLVELDGAIVEQPAELDRFSAISGEPQTSQHRLRDVVHAIEKAAGDSAIKAVVLDLDRFAGGGQVALGRVGDALGKVRKAGKPVLAYATYYDDDAYQLAAHASEIWLAPIGLVGVTGPGGSNLYYKGLIEKIGAKVNVYRVGTFKSAVEPYLLSGQSDAARTANQALVAAIWGQWQEQVSKARPKAKLMAYVNDPVSAMRAAGGDSAKAAQAAGLIDRIGDRITFGTHVAELAGASTEERPGDYSAVPMAAYLTRHPVDAAAGAVAVVTVAGDIVDGEAGPGVAAGSTIAGLIRDALASGNMKALVLRVDSPGGSVTASEEIRQALLAVKAQKIPVVASMGNVAASGGYWVSTAADKIIAEPDTITGSIGVFGVLPSFEGSLAQIGVTSDGVKATSLAGEPDVLGGVSDEFNALAQMSVEDMYRRFIGLVSAARKLSPERVDAIAQGRVWDGGTARQLGLVDQFGSLEDAVAMAAQLAKLEGAQAAPLYVEPERDPFTMFLEGTGFVRATPQAVPTDWLGRAAMRQRATLARAFVDAQAILTGPAMRADCLECRAYMPLSMEAPPQSGWLGWLTAQLAR